MDDITALNTLKQRVPVSTGNYALKKREKTGLIIIDEVNGFCTVGSGPLAPVVTNDQIVSMVRETDKLARYFESYNLPIAVFLDTHTEGKLESPYPPHCEKGTGQELLVPELDWLNESNNALLIKKDCINGFVGSYLTDGKNLILDWIKEYQLETVIVTGICTDICVMDFVLTLLSARNHGMTFGLQDVVVYEKGCSTYSLPLETTKEIGLPETAAHPQAITHHMGLYFMASRGAILADSIHL